jgi:hypothetical protein
MKTFLALMFAAAAASAQPLPYVNVSNVSLPEGTDQPSQAIFKVTFSAPLASSYKITYQLHNETTSANDYQTPSPASLTVPAGATSASIAIPIVPDRTPEPDEIFTLLVTSPMAEPYSANHPLAICTILNDDYALTPAFLRAAAGTRPELTFDIGNPALSARNISFFSSAPSIVKAPLNVTVPPNMTKISIPFNALLPGSATVDALVGVSFVAEARIEVYEATSFRFDPASVSVARNAEQTIRVSFNPPVTQPQTVVLAIGGSAVLDFPSIINVPAGGVTEVKFKGVVPGRGEITFGAQSLGIAAALPVEVTDTPPPSIDSVSPAWGLAGTRVTIAGANFGSQCTVAFGDASAVVETRSASSLVVVAPNGTGAVDVKVTCGTAGATKSRAFTYGTVRRRASH